VVKVTFIDRGQTITLDAPLGASLMSVATRNGVEGIEAVCGGACSCATCHVYVDETWLPKLPKRSDDEAELLDFSIGVEPNSRLSCQINVTEDLDGLVVTVPDQQY
jgi:2Fe-2S ferredoxin